MLAAVEPIFVRSLFPAVMDVALQAGSAVFGTTDTPELRKSIKLVINSKDQSLNGEVNVNVHGMIRASNDKKQGENQLLLSLYTITN